MATCVAGVVPTALQPPKPLPTALLANVGVTEPGASMLVGLGVVAEPALGTEAAPTALYRPASLLVPATCTNKLTQFSREMPLMLISKPKPSPFGNTTVLPPGNASLNVGLAPQVPTIISEGTALAHTSVSIFMPLVELAVE